MLENKFTLNPIGDYGQIALFSPNIAGSYKISLIKRNGVIKY